MVKVSIIDYGMGNLFSISNALKKVGLESSNTSDPMVVEESDAVILPGVGSFGAAMDTLKNLGLINVIKKFIESGKPFMGICLGFQLLFSESEEFGISKGLEILNGVVKKFPCENENFKKIKIPQIGWNQIYKFDKKKSWKNSPLNGIKEGEFMYFVHSYYVEPNDNEIKLTKTFYDGFEYCSSIYYENIFASQFHPEKSAHEGIKIYKEFAKRIKQHL